MMNWVDFFLDWMDGMRMGGWVSRGEEFCPLGLLVFHSIRFCNYLNAMLVSNFQISELALQLLD